MSVEQTVISTLVAKLTLDTVGFSSGVSSVTGQTNRLLKAAGIIGGATTAAAKKATNAAMDFETAFTSVTKTVNAPEGKNAAEFFTGLRQEILDMSEELPTAASEIAGVYAAAGQLGIDAENLTTFSRAMLSMASSTNLGSEEAATALARLANVTHMDQTEFDRLGSSIVELGNNTATTEKEIVEYAQRLSLMGASMGMSEADIVAYGATISSLGMESASSATALIRFTNQVTSAVAAFTGTSSENIEFFNRVAQASSKELKAMAETTGLSTKELKSLANTFNDNATTLKTLANVAGMTSEEFATAWGENATAALSTFFDAFGQLDAGEQLAIFDALEIKQVNEQMTLKTLAAGNDLLTDSLEMSNRAWEENTALTNEADKANSTTAAQVQMFNNNLDELYITVGTNLLPVINDLLNAITPVVEKITEWAAANPTLTSGLMITGVTLSILATAINAIGGPAVLAITAIVGLITVVGLLVDAFGEADKEAEAFAEKVANINSSVETLQQNSYGQMEIKQYTYTTGVVSVDFDEDALVRWDEFAQRWVTQEEDIARAAKETNSALTEQAEAVTGVSDAAVESEIGTTLAEPVETTKTAAEQAQEVLTSMQEAVTNLGTVTDESMGESIDQLTGLLENEAFQQFANQPISEEVGSSWNGFGAAVQSAADGFDNLDSQLSDGSISGAIESIAGVAAAAAASFVDMATSIYAAIDAYLALLRVKSGGGAGGTGKGYDMLKASGGPVLADTPYIVGELGPELFVPHSNGTIIPNDELGGQSINLGGVHFHGDVIGDEKSIAGYVTKAVNKGIQEAVYAAA